MSTHGSAAGLGGAAGAPSPSANSSSLQRQNSGRASGPERVFKCLPFLNSPTSSSGPSGLRRRFSPGLSPTPVRRPASSAGLPRPLALFRLHPAPSPSSHSSKRERASRISRREISGAFFGKLHVFTLCSMPRVQTQRGTQRGAHKCVASADVQEHRAFRVPQISYPDRKKNVTRTLNVTQ